MSSDKSLKSIGSELKRAKDIQIGTYTAISVLLETDEELREFRNWLIATDPLTDRLILNKVAEIAGLK